MSRSLVLLFVIGAMPALRGDWNARRTADYLDSRQKEWFAWRAAAASGGPCISCHTGVTYLLARPALRRALRENQPTTYEAGLLAGLRARVSKADVKEGPHAMEAQGVEAVLSALFLASDDVARGTWSAETRQAFERMWAMQIKEGPAKGAWEWFSLKLDPWEMPQSRFFGASLAAMAAGTAPAEYRARPEVVEGMAALTAYLQREQQSQPLHNRLVLLWSSTKLRAALPGPARRALIDEAFDKQQDDGGWTIASLGPWESHAAAPESVGSNSYATALTAFVLQKAGVPRGDKRLARALDWLKSHQDGESGTWAAPSMNKVYEPGSMQERFMQDAATSYAALALLEAGVPE